MASFEKVTLKFWWLLKTIYVKIFYLLCVKCRKMVPLTDLKPLKQMSVYHLFLEPTI